jgi:hypothetical protein
MANNFISYANKDVGTSAATVVTVGSSTQTTVIGLSCANTSIAPVTVDVYITTSDVLKVVSSSAASIDVITSVLNIT